MLFVSTTILLSVFIAPLGRWYRL